MALKALLAGAAWSVDYLPSFYTITALIPILTTIYLYLRPSILTPKGTPPLLKEDWPIVGTLRFFTGRWDFFKEALAVSDSFSFFVGAKHVIAVSGPEARKAYFDSKELDMTSAYAALLSGSPSPPNPEVDEELPEGAQISFNHPRWFIERLQAMLKGGIIRRGIPKLVNDVRTSLDRLATNGNDVTNPFESIYRIVFQLTMRTVACQEIADDPVLLSRSLRLFEEVEEASTPITILYPWIPLPAKFKRLWGGTQLYLMFKNIIDQRRKTGHPEDDALKFLMDDGADVKSIITFVLGALFAGQLNSGINAAWVLIYLSQTPEWKARALAEIKSVAAKYDPDGTKSLVDRLSSVPGDAWESEFPMLELCLRDSIRIQMAGSFFRKNTSDKPISIPTGNGKITIPPGSHLMYHVGDIHLNSEVYPDPLRWDPGRYLADRAEDKKAPNAFLGWGLGRHPCTGQRFAKLESNIITAFFLAYFDFEYCDGDGNTEGVKPPPMNVNGFSAHRPKVKCCLKYKIREVSEVSG